MVITRSQQQRIEDEKERQYLQEINRLGGIEIEGTGQSQTTEIFVVRRPLSFEMSDKVLASRISKQLDQLPIFHGKLNENIIKWLKDMTNELNLVHFDDCQKLTVIQTYLADDARKWFINNMSTLDSWSKFCQEVCKTYPPMLAKELAIGQVGQQQQGLDETVMHYYNDMMELFDVMDPHMSDALKVSYLKNGLKLSLRKEVARKNPQTPLEFIKAAQEEESLDHCITTFVQNNEPTSKHELQSFTPMTKVNSSPIQRRYPYSSYPPRQIQQDSERYYSQAFPSNKRDRQQFLSQQVCYQCNRPGHFARDCRYSKNY